MANTKNARIAIVNLIIIEIAKRGRNFFSHKGQVESILLKNGRLYIKYAYRNSEMCINTKHGYPPKGWSSGGTLWALVKDFKDFNQTWDKSNHNNGYGGLYCSHWGYPESDMLAIQEFAKSVGYL